MRNLTKLAVLFLALALSACGPSEPASDTAADTSTAAADAAPPATTEPAAAPEPAAPTTGLWFEPAALSACGPTDNVVKVNWDVSANPDVASVEIVITEPNSPEGMFAATVPKGSKDSGPWMHPGSTMVLRNAADGAELARATMESIPCP